MCYLPRAGIAVSTDTEVTEVCVVEVDAMQDGEVDPEYDRHGTVGASLCRRVVWMYSRRS